MAKTTVPGLYIADGAITAAKLSSTLDLSGVTITVATASTGDSDTSVASTAFVQQEIAALVDSSPSALNTLNELAAAIGDDASFSTTVTNSIATKLPLAGGTLTGNLIINTTGSIQIPVGTTAQRPTAAQGQLRFNTTTSKPEIYSGSAWTDVGGGVESVNSATGVVVLTTANIAENTNLYYTDARADARIAAADTDDLSEGSTNLYFTTARANSAFDGRLSGSTGVTVSNGAVSIGQDVATSTSPTFQNLTLSGTNSIKVPSGTTAQRSGSPANGMLRYNSSTNEFEGYADSAWGAIGGDTTSSVDLYTATGNGSTATYDTGKNPQSENNTWVFVGGVYQPKSTYSFSGTQITLSENLPNGEDLEVITGTVSTYNPTDAILGQYNVTTSNTASYDTSLTTENENNVFVFVDGVYQPKSSYTYSGSTLTLDAVPTSGMALEVLVTRSMNAATVTTGFLADDAVTTVKILDANVTSAKLASSLDLTGKTVTVATASTGDNDTSVASTAFVRQEITALVDSAPAAMDTLNELAAALGDDANFSTTVNNSIALKAPLASPTFTGNAVFDTTTLVVDASNNRIGVGTASPRRQMHIHNSASATVGLMLTNGNTGESNDSQGFQFKVGSDSHAEISQMENSDLRIFTNATEAMRIDNNQNLLVGTTNTLPANNNVEGIALSAGSYGGRLEASRSGGAPCSFNRVDSDGSIIELRKAGTTVGTIGNSGSNLVVGGSGTNKSGFYFGDDALFPVKNGSLSASTISFGSPNYRFKDLYLSGTANIGDITINGSTISRGGSGDLFFDVGGNIQLDADDNGEVRFIDGGTQYATIKKDGNAALFQSIVADGDFIIQGIDGSSFINAVRFDMSEAGSAYFNNKVGIGTTDPASLLHLKSTANSVGPTLIFENTNNAQSMNIDYYNNAGAVQSRIGYDEGPAAFSFKPNVSSTAMYIAYSGNVGIGTSDPKVELDVYGDLSGIAVGRPWGNDAYESSGYFGKLANNGDWGAGSAFMKIEDSLSAGVRKGTNIDFVTHNYGGGNQTTMTLSAEGNVGIGTTTPGSLLEIRGSEPILTLRDTRNVGGTGWSETANEALGEIQFWTSDGTGVGPHSTAAIKVVNDITAASPAGAITFKTNAYNQSGAGTERMRLTSAGVLTINGVTDSFSGLVNGRGHIFRANGESFHSMNDAGSANTLHVYDFADSAYRFYVRATGSSAGVIHATSTSITGLSDERLKENIKDLETGLSEVMSLKPRRFDWKEGEGTKQKNVAGFIAQEVESVLPELVGDYKHEELEDCKSLKMGDIVPTLVKAIQEQQEQIETLQREVQKLKE